MRAELQKLYSGLDAMSREELVLSFRRLIEECSEKDARLEIAGSAATEMSRQFQQIKDENAALKKENKELLRQNRKLTDQLRMRSRDLFGRSSEQTSGIVDAILDENPEDPALESAPEPEQTDRPDHEEAEALEKELERQRGKGTWYPRGPGYPKTVPQSSSRHRGLADNQKRYPRGLADLAHGNQVC